MVTYRAHWILPVCGPPLNGAFVTIEGTRIVEIGGRPAGQAIDLGDVVLAPGFVNAHTHLDLSGARGRIRNPTSFVDGLEQVVAFRRQEESGGTDSTVASAIEELLDGGTTLVGDISCSGASAQHLQRSGLPAVVFHEVIGSKAERYEPLWRSALEFLAKTASGESAVTRGVSPHAPFSTSAEVYRRAARLGPAVPIATHWLETAEEVEFVNTGQGPLREFLLRIGAVDERPSTCELASSDSFKTMLNGPARWILIHANYLSPQAMQRSGDDPLGNVAAGVVFCPRTHAYFGHREHPWLQLRDHGVPVALGTDSLASNPDLSVFNEARYLAAHCDQATPTALLEMLTRDGAAVLNRGSRTGTLSAGQRADLVVLSAPITNTDDPAADVFAPHTRVVGVMIGGVWKRTPPALSPRG
jgi:cytosine/adenosine deaminase-related metal-dependent hydrolase